MAKAERNDLDSVKDITWRTIHDHVRIAAIELTELFSDGINVTCTSDPKYCTVTIGVQIGNNPRRQFRVRFTELVE